MEKQYFLKCLMILFLSGSFLSCRQKPVDESVIRSTEYSKSLKEAYQKLGLFYTTNSLPGLTVAVSIGNQVIWADGIGYSNLELKTKTSPSHLVRIGQISELITALTAAKLYEEGKLNIDKPVSEYLPEMNQNADKFTIRQLGAHAAGIRAAAAEAGKGNANSLKTLVPGFMNDNLEFTPGSYFSHTELGMDMMGYLLEKTSNQAFAKLVKQTVLDTLKLMHTVPDNPYRITENKCSLYDFDYIAQPIVSSQIDLRGKEASAGYLSSVLDLVKIGNTLLYPGFLKQETIDLMTKPYKLSSGLDGQYGFGLIVTKDNDGETFYGLTGTVNGGSAALLIYPDDKLVIAIASNIGSHTTELPVFEIAKVFKDQLHPEKAEKPKGETQETK